MHGQQKYKKKQEMYGFCNTVMDTTVKQEPAISWVTEQLTQ